MAELNIRNSLFRYCTIKCGDKKYMLIYAMYRLYVLIPVLWLCTDEVCRLQCTSPQWQPVSCRWRHRRRLLTVGTACKHTTGIKHYISERNITMRYCLGPKWWKSDHLSLSSLCIGNLIEIFGITKDFSTVKILSNKKN